MKDLSAYQARFRPSKIHRVLVIQPMKTEDLRCHSVRILSCLSYDEFDIEANVPNFTYGKASVSEAIR